MIGRKKRYKLFISFIHPFTMTTSNPTPSQNAASTTAQPAAKTASASAVPAPATAASKTKKTAVPETKTAAKAPAKKPVKRPAASAPAKAKPTAASPALPAKEVRAKKPKLVRDSFTIPKNEYAVIEALKQRANALAQPVKKSELLRAGLKLLAGLSDAALRSALQAVPSIKTGRPKAETPATKTAAKITRK